MVFTEPNMWIRDEGPSPAMVDQSEDTASGEAEVPAMPISTSDATADYGATYIRDLKVLYMYKSTIWFSGNGSV